MPKKKKLPVPPEELRRAVADGGDAVLLVGAGVSYGASGRREEARWTGLLRNGIARCEALCELREGWGDHQRVALDRGDDDEMVGVAEAIRRKLEPKPAQQQRFSNWLKETVGSLELVEPAVPERLARLGLPLLTTNYDGLLEEAAGLPAVTWCQPEKVLAALRADAQERGKAGVVHLHGYWEEPESVVLGVRDYARVLGSNAAQILQKGFSMLRTVVFVGCGAGLEDPNFTALRRWLSDTFRHQGHSHFRLCRESELTALRRLHKDDNITPVSFGAKHSDLPEFLDALLAAKRHGAAGRRAAASTRASRATPAEPAGLVAYKQWALDTFGRVQLIGLGRADLKLGLDEIFVPLRFGARVDELHALGRRGVAGEPGEGHGDIRLEELFAPRPGEAEPSPHALILGEPGAGKSTVLRKLLHQALTEGAESLNLPEGTVPLFGRLRSLSWMDVKGKEGGPPLDLAAFLGRELEEQSEGKLPARTAVDVFKSGKALLLLDGLDEVADEELRAEVCRYLEYHLAGAHRKGIRAVVSCRSASYEKEIKLRNGFRPVEVRPLEGEEVNELIQLWFREVERTSDALEEGEAREKASGLIDKLGEAEYAGQKVAQLLSTPLMVTLLCIVVLRGEEIPRKRTELYREGLDVLLSRWGRAQGRGEPPVETDDALLLLRHLAFRLHEGGERDALSAMELARRIRGLLPGTDAPALIRWLYQDAGVLAQVADNEYGFAHLGFQEYLTAVHIAAVRGEELTKLANRAGEKWWREVLRLVVGLPGRAVFAPLMEALLKRDDLLECEGMLRECLAEAAEVDLAPFITVLEGRAASRRKAFVLRLLLNRRERSLVEAARSLEGHNNRDVRTLAKRLVDLARGGKPGGDHCEALLFHGRADVEPAAELAAAFEAAGIAVLRLSADREWQNQLEAILKIRHLVLLAGAEEPPFRQGRAAEELLRFAAQEGLPVLLAELPDAAGTPSWPEDLPAPLRVEARRPGWEEVLRAVGEALQARPAPAVPGRPSKRAPSQRSESDTGAPFDEPLTGTRLLWIRPGDFQMGAELPESEHSKWPDWVVPAAQPIHPVTVSGFWLAETPVTNRQYALYLERTKAKEPEYWRDRRFSAPEQPVVGVSWEEAVAFCDWLSEETGRRFSLPTEAQWEYAARGPKGREYPWGSKPPDDTRACYGLDYGSDQPAPVGSYPAGAGPFGTLDQAGVVWEWCWDVWDEEAYSGEVHQAGVDPVVMKGSETDARVVRGGCWVDPAENLRSAIRDWVWARGRGGVVGFRVCVSSASPDSWPLSACRGTDGVGGPGAKQVPLT